MTYIVLDEEQARVISESQGKVELRDAKGNHLGYVWHGFTKEEIFEAKRRADSDGPWYSTEQVLEHLRSLDN